MWGVRRSVLVLTAYLFAAFLASPAWAAEIKVVSSTALAEVLRELAPAFERQTGHTLVLTFENSAGVKRVVESGAEVDLAIAAPTQIQELIGAGRLVRGSDTAIARSGIGVAIRVGAPKPDISTPDAFRRAMLEARSIIYSKEGASGRYVASLFERLGISDQIRDKVRLKPVAGPVAEDVAKGDAELGLQQISEILPVRGAELVGPLPAELQSYLVLTAGVGATAKEPGPAGEMMRFMAGPASAEVMRRHGLEPAR